jgi:hypothetical protein
MKYMTNRSVDVSKNQCQEIVTADHVTALPDIKIMTTQDKHVG